MKYILRCIILVLASTVHAEDLQFDITGDAYSGYTGPPAGPVDISFTLDTQSGTGSQQLWPSGDLESCTAQGLFLSNVNITLNGQQLLTTGAFLGEYGGSNATPGGIFIVSLFFTDSATSLLWNDILSIAQPNSDPTASLFTGLLTGLQGTSTGHLHDNSGQLYSLEFNNTQVTDPANVPEPGTLPLIALGLVGLLLMRNHAPTPRSIAVP